MINLVLEENLETQIKGEIEILEKYKDVFNKKFDLCNKNLSHMKLLIETELDINKEEIINSLINKLEEEIEEYKFYFLIINNNFERLNYLLLNYNDMEKFELKKQINKYNEKFKMIFNYFVINEWDFENPNILEQIDNKKQEIAKKITDVEINKEILKEKEEEVVINNNDEKIENNDEKIENNDTLLISEISGKVILPYTVDEIDKVLEENKGKYGNAKEVIDKVYTRSLSDYKIQFLARYTETIKLIVEREGYKKLEAITLALEMARNRYLYPAIITACKTLDELDVYLDCLEKNELDDFKIFKIKYELYPKVIKNTVDNFEGKNN